MKYFFRLFLLAFSVAFLYGCEPSSETHSSDSDSDMSTSTSEAPRDVHSHAVPEIAHVSHLDLDIAVDFETKTITGRASYDLVLAEGATEIVLDARDLSIQGVTAGGNDSSDSLAFAMGETFDPIKGTSLTIQLTEGTERINVFYQTSPEAAALQWLSPSQTAGKEQPFLFTQGQAILTRTWLPCQDGPGMRFTYDARVTVPSNLMAVMSATNPTEHNDQGVYEFEMAQPIPAYLMALSVGDLEFAPIGEQTGVYAEPSVLEAAVYEFGDMEKMLVSAEELYGPYRWERYDVIVLPPSFPFGGMENPRLTFATPTILAGDRSLTSLIAHELAHSWSGNLVTNATWDDFWLNEGFTVYFERRIMEKLYGESYVKMLAMLGHQDLDHTLKELGTDSKDTHLKLDLIGRDPDEGMTDIAYEKGYFLLTHIENSIGREAFDAFLRQYFDENAFTTMTTEDFVQYVDENLVKGDETLKAELALEKWIYAPGLPAGFEAPYSDRFEKVDSELASWTGGTAAKDLAGTGEWSTHEWLHFIRKLPAGLSGEQMADLDGAFGLTASGNSEIQAAWFEHVIRNQYEAGYASLEAFLIRVGRRKFLKPLYTTLAETESGKEMGRDIYAKARSGYHSVSVGTIDEILDYN